MQTVCAAARRGLSASVAAIFVSLSLASSGSAQTMRDRIVDSVANTMAHSIQTDSCADFAAMLKKHKSGSGSGASKASGMMKSDPAARARFVNKVAGPLLNKMIDCDLLPGR